MQKKFGNIKLYFSSPNVSNPEIFLELFNRNKQNSFKTNESPVSQNIYFVNLENLEVETYYDNKPVLLKNILNSRNNYELLDFIQFVGEGKNNLIYCYSKRNTINKTIKLAEKVQKKELSKEVRQAIKNIKEYQGNSFILLDIRNLKG